jgi:hypothetical protein
MRRALLLLAVFAAAAPAAAQENDDLSLIPGAVQSAPPAATQAASHGKYSVEDAFGLWSYRGAFAVPMVGAMPSRWSNRASFDALDTWRLGPNLTATLSDRLSVSFADGVGFPNESVRNDPREAYLTWEPLPEAYLEAGRINVRNGVAFGYNPTDFFRARTSVAMSSADPGAMRNNRLGTAMLRAQRIFDGGSVEFIYAPKLHVAAPLYATADPFDPKFDQTNGADRFLASFSFELEEFSPQLLVYHESGRTKFGLNISHPIGGSIIAYASWAGGRAPGVTADAIAFGRRTGTLPSFMPLPPYVSAARSFRNEVSTGASWTGEGGLSVIVEYNFNQAGFSKDDWRGWFAVGADPTMAPFAWYIRGYAGDRQLPMTQHQAFVRLDCPEPFDIKHFDINGFVMGNLTDGSTLGQLGVNYDISDKWSAGAYLGLFTGGARSEWGSMRTAASAVVQLVRYL